MTTQKQVKAKIMEAQMVATQLNVAYIGVSSGLLAHLQHEGPKTTEELAKDARKDAQYVRRWCEAAFAFELLDRNGDAYAITEFAKAFLSREADSLLPMAINGVLGAYLSDRAVELMNTGERPGEKILGERKNILPLFGPLLETSFKPLFNEFVIPNLPIYQEIDAKGGTVVDLGCGNGWYLRSLAARFSNLHGIGLDMFDENVQQAADFSTDAGFDKRLTFKVGDIYHFTVEKAVDAITMSRALHHVWDQKDTVMKILHDHLNPGGAAIIWEPEWPSDVAKLREPTYKMKSFQNLNEHMQGNHFLNSAEVTQAFESVGMKCDVFRFLQDSEMVIVARKSQ